MTHTAQPTRALRRMTHIAAGIALLALASQAAWAQSAAPAPLGPFALRAGYSLQNDSNLFRTSTGARSEQIGVTTLGLGFVTNQGLQKIEANVSAVDSRYQSFDFLSYTATNYDAAWHWAVSPEWTGNLSTTRNETLNNFANVTNTTVRNRRVTTGSGLDTTYTLQGAWRAVGGISASKQTNDQTVVGVDDFSSSTGDLGLQYSFASGSAITYRASFTNGSYLNRSVPNAILADDSYKEVANDLRLHWAFSGASTVDVFATALNRTHPTYASRDFSGVNTGLSLNWIYSGKTGVLLSATHTLSAYETFNTNYSTNDTISIAPTWQISPKLGLHLNAQWGQIGYQGSPSAVPTLDRKDNTQDTSLSLVWTPTQQWNLAASLQKSTRTSNLAGQDYDANVVGLSATFSF